ncbi:conserved Plasmodium protein, unknown function [Plasmodium relictum]|uniref:Uncharacterized protein n=1 Tax=Plasmodium relictum TaxID=85471 RepID=A0A1J1H1S0_PLARL|nr:conserved Plasmodium protein, unknown function [Plasmodium relictum]CRG98874.1 conserved Plasmodium protein, unknown function [Plasmodium relictum]
MNFLSRLFFFLFALFFDILLSKSIRNTILFLCNQKKFCQNKWKRKYYTLNNNEKKEDKLENENFQINEFEREEIKINKSLNVNIFRDENESSAYDKGLSFYNLLKDIEIKDVKKIPAFNQNLANISIEKKNDTIKLHQKNDKSHLENSLIYKNTNYDLPYILNYYPDDIFIFNFDGVINLNKQEKIVVAFLTFIKIFNQEFLFNNKRIINLPLYDFIKEKNYLFNNNGSSSDSDSNNNTNNNNNTVDTFILLKLIPKFIYTRLLYIYKYLRNNEDIVIAIKYIYDQINDICIKYNYDINEMMNICCEKNVLEKKLKKIERRKFNKKYSIENNKSNDYNRTINEDTYKGGSFNNSDNSDNIKIYDITEELTEGTFNPYVIYKYKNIENFPNIFPSFRIDFEDFYLNNTYLKLYEKYKINMNYVKDEFNNIRNLLIKNDKESYENLMKYRYVCVNLNEEERKNHETFNFCCIDIINNNINVFKKPIYIISTIENTNFIKYTLQLFGLNILEKENEHLLRIFGNDTNNSEEEENDENNILFNLKNYLKNKYFTKNSEEKKDDYIHDSYNLDINYLKYFKKTKKKDYYYNKNIHYMNMLKKKCDLVNYIIEKYYDDNSIHVIDHKYDDLNALNNDSRINKKIKLYFCEWGYSTYEEKLKAIFNDKIKTFSQTFKLIYLCCTLQNSPRREYTHGKGISQDFYSKFMYKYCLKNNIISETDPFDNLT